MLIHVQAAPAEHSVAVEVKGDDTVFSLKVRACRAAAVRADLTALEVNGELRTDDEVKIKDTTLADGDTVVLRQVKMDVKIERRDRVLSEARLEIRKKPRWFEKIGDDTIREKWAQELLAQFEAAEQNIDDPVKFDEKGAVAHMLSLLQDEADLIASGAPKKTLEPYFMRLDDNLLPDGFAARLDKALEVFRGIPDWHPGSNNQVMDLIHPSMYCAVNDKPTDPKPRWNSKPESRYQWLPADFRVGDGERKVAQESYINNLDPAVHGQDTEDLVVEALCHFLPLLRTCRDPANTAEVTIETQPELTQAEQDEVDGVIESVKRAALEQAEEDGEFHEYEDLIDTTVTVLDWASEGMAADSQEFKELLIRYFGKHSATSQDFRDAAVELGYIDESSNEAQAAEGETPEEWYSFVMKASAHDDRETWKKRISALYTKAQGDEIYSHETVNLRTAAIERKAEDMARSLREQNNRLVLSPQSRLQVIVKAADIVLTPENPVYPGGTWHLEGMSNENIVATGIYYYQQENVTPSHLEFRVAVDPCEFEYPQCEFAHIFLRYRAENGDQQNRWLGEVSTPEGRCIVFPNDLQHRAQPFQLVDATKPGVRKMLVFFVVDPGTPILSSSTVPRQQGTMAHEQALANRLALMEDRKKYVVAQNEEMQEEISLCEH